MLGQHIFTFASILTLLFTCGSAKITVPNCSCGALPTLYASYRFGCECFHKQPLTNQSVFPAPSLPVNLTTLYLGVQDDAWESFRNPYCQAGNSSYSYLSADTQRLLEGTSLQFISFSNFDFTKGRAKEISPWLDNAKSTLTEMEIVCGKLITLSTGVLVGFPKLTKLTITGTYLQNIEPGAFGELSTSAKPVLTTLDLSHNSVWHFDWAVLHPFASSLQSFLMTNGALSVMQASLDSFPELRRIDLAYNPIPMIPKTVVKTWPKSNHLAVNLIHNRLCRWDSLCRCCSLLPLLRFSNESNAQIFMECGNLDSKMILNETSFASVSQAVQTSFCTNKYHTRMTVEDFMEVGNISQFDSCNEDDEPHVLAQLCKLPASPVVPTISGSSPIFLSDAVSHSLSLALMLILTMML